MQTIIRALALVYAFCVSDSATPQGVSLAVDGGSQALLVSHPGTVGSLIEEALSAQ